MSETRMFPLQVSNSRLAAPGPIAIPWSVAEIAYGAYVERYGDSQSMGRIAERAGFSWAEMDDLYPAWRAEVSAIARLTKERDELRALCGELRDFIEDHKDDGHMYTTRGHGCLGCGCYPGEKHHSACKLAAALAHAKEVLGE